ncbi:MAG: hypothetical protein GTO40_28170, partial [Deltaproteobacteria bacterium]|nr:hypothetical protein [Deltaproteobacteria bacterium]
MKDWVKPYLLQKSVEAIRELGVQYKKDEVLAKKSKELESEQREYERLWIEFPVIYKIGRNTITGSTVNACSEGLMVESYLSSKTASKIFKIINKRPAYRLRVKYT